MSEEKIAHVICLNDGVMAVVLDDEDRANEVCKEMKQEDLEQRMKLDPSQNKEDLSRLLYYHLHSVPIK